MYTVGRRSQRAQHLQNAWIMAQAIRPSAVYSYIDKAQIWLRHPLSEEQLLWLQNNCRGKLHVRTRPKRLGRFHYVQRIQLRQPSNEVLQFFSERNDALLNIAEVALDWVFADQDTRDDAFNFVCSHHVKRHHRDQGVRSYPGRSGNTRYSGPRKAPNVLAIYADKPCRITGDLYCVHLDWRIRTVAGLRRIGITSAADLIALNHHVFWTKRLLLQAVDQVHLGRLVNNFAKSSKRRRPWVQQWTQSGLIYDYDRRAGSIIKHAFRTTQEVIDELGRTIRLTACLHNIDVRHLLPLADHDIVL